MQTTHEFEEIAECVVIMFARIHVCASQRPVRPFDDSNHEI